LGSSSFLILILKNRAFLKTLTSSLSNQSLIAVKSSSKDSESLFSILKRYLKRQLGL